MFIVSTDRPEGQKMRLTEEEEQRWSAGKCFFKVLSFPRFLCSSSSRRPSWAWRCCTACRTTAGRGSPPGCTAWACVPYSSSPLCSISSPGRRATWGEEKLNDGGGTLWMLCSHTETTCILLSYCFWKMMSLPVSFVLVRSVSGLCWLFNNWTCLFQVCGTLFPHVWQSGHIFLHRCLLHTLVSVGQWRLTRVLLRSGGRDAI